MPEFRPTYLTVFAVSLASALHSGSAFAQDLRQRFETISMGMPKATVLMLMPPPSSSTENMWLGLQSERLRWFDGRTGPAFSVRLVAGRVYAKTACDRLADC
jgi:hypothetical protein